MTVVEIEVADTADVDSVVDLWVDLAQSQRTHGSHIPGEANRTQIRESVLRHITADRLLVARRDGVVGFVMFSLEQGSFEQDRTRGVVENLYVEPESRNDGVGSALLSHAESRLETRGVDAVFLNVMAENEAARRFYRRHGYGTHRLEFEKAIDTPP